MSELSQAAIEVLRKIDEQGLCVRWSFKVPEPRYGQSFDDGNDVPNEDWQIVWSELSHIETDHHRFIASQYQTISRDIALGNRQWCGIVSTPRQDQETNDTQRLGIFPNAIQEFYHARNELVLSFGMMEAGVTDVGNVLQVTFESTETKVEYDNSHVRIWVSEWLEREHVPMDEHYEEIVGMIDRYELTDAAKELIGK